MRFTSEKLVLIRQALESAQSHCSNEIGLHPEPLKWPEDITRLEGQRTRYAWLQGQVEAELRRRGAHLPA